MSMTHHFLLKKKKEKRAKRFEQMLPPKHPHDIFSQIVFEKQL